MRELPALAGDSGSLVAAEGEAGGEERGRAEEDEDEAVGEATGVSGLPLSLDEELDLHTHDRQIEQLAKKTTSAHR